jgi:hypothetical protein
MPYGITNTCLSYFLSIQRTCLPDRNARVSKSIGFDVPSMHVRVAYISIHLAVRPTNSTQLKFSIDNYIRVWYLSLILFLIVLLWKSYYKLNPCVWYLFHQELSFYARYNSGDCCLEFKIPMFTQIIHRWVTPVLWFLSIFGSLVRNGLSYAWCFGCAVYRKGERARRDVCVSTCDRSTARRAVFSI